MTRRGIEVPVLIGGAAISRRYVEQDCVEAYGAGNVAYAGDVFDGLRLMEAVMAERFTQVSAAGKRPGRAVSRGTAPVTHGIGERPVDRDEVRLRRAELHADVEVPAPPFWGSRVIKRLAPETLLALLDKTMLFDFHWGFKKAGRSRGEWKQILSSYRSKPWKRPVRRRSKPARFFCNSCAKWRLSDDW